MAGNFADRDYGTITTMPTMSTAEEISIKRGPDTVAHYLVQGIRRRRTPYMSWALAAKLKEAGERGGK